MSVAAWMPRCCATSATAATTYPPWCPRYTFDNGICFQVVDDLRRRQFGPPSEWEIFKVTCRGPCFTNYHRVKDVYEASGCQCAQFQEYKAFVELVGWERTIPECLQFNTDHLCKVCYRRPPPPTLCAPPHVGVLVSCNVSPRYSACKFAKTRMSGTAMVAVAAAGKPHTKTRYVQSCLL